MSGLSPTSHWPPIAPPITFHLVDLRSLQQWQAATAGSDEHELRSVVETAVAGNVFHFDIPAIGRSVEIDDALKT